MAYSACFNGVGDVGHHLGAIDVLDLVAGQKQHHVRNVAWFASGLRRLTVYDLTKVDEAHEDPWFVGESRYTE
ncbi:MAG: hypothetical protein CMQ29_14925 [Gammaproteobacteria bacterium]|nr:hypothetical protein [Gammaproteobacteria bacterium]